MWICNILFKKKLIIKDRIRVVIGRKKREVQLWKIGQRKRILYNQFDEMGGLI